VYPDSILWLLPLELLWIAFISTWIVLEKRRPSATLAWIFALIWLPIIGFVVYLVLGPRKLERKRLRHVLARQVVGSAAPQAPAPPEPVEAALSERVRQLESLGVATGEGPILPARAATLYADGASAYAAIEAAIRAARHHVHLTYYIVAPDAAGRWLRDLLVDRARAGVEVRLLVDAIGSARLGRRFLRPLREAGAEVAVFNPIGFARFRPSLVNFRTHRKIVVVDGEVGFTGGMNICDEQSATFSGERAWRDTHLRLEGDGVRWLQKVFLEDWHFARGEAPTSAAYLPAPAAEGTVPVQVLSSGPDEQRHPIEKAFYAAIAGARQRVWATTPYFVPGAAMIATLSTAALRGVDVRLIVPRRGDSRLVDAAARSSFGELLRSGVRIFAYRPTMLHAKTLVVDDEVAYVGTANLDNRSFRLNFEVVVALYHPPTVARLAELFEADLGSSEPITAEELAADSLPARIAQGVARLFTPLL